MEDYTTKVAKSVQLLMDRFQSTLKLSDGFCDKISHYSGFILNIF